MKTWSSAGTMSPMSSVLMLVVWTNLFAPLARGQVAGEQIAQPPAKPAWLEGSGKDLRIRLAGKICDETGAPAQGCKLTVASRSESTSTIHPVTLEGNRFETWVPAADVKWFSINLHVTSPDGRVARERLADFQLRQAAIDGLDLTIKRPERTVEVSVVEKGASPVRDAFVAAEVDGEEMTARSNDKGIASFPMRNRDQLQRLSAWTDDFRIGGYVFYRSPPRDEYGSKHTVELQKCRPQTIRIISEETKAPVPNLPFLLNVGTGAPNYQFFGQTPGSVMKTNEKGEAVYRWFPDLKTPSTTVTITDPHWTKAAKEEMVEGVVLVKVKQSRLNARKRVVGQITSKNGNVAGLHVEMWSFKGEEEHRSDVLGAFTDEYGVFAADYLPGSTYCIYVNDARFVSNIIDLLPNDSATGKTKALALTIAEGQPIEIMATSGSAKSPIPHQIIQLTTPHEYSWREQGETRYGRSGRRWWVETDDQGKAHTVALAGKKIDGLLYTPLWRLEVSADVKVEGVTRLEFHRKFASARTINGRLLLPPGLRADLQKAVLQIESADGETEEHGSLKTNAHGEFQHVSKAARIGIYARTRDGHAAVVAIVDRLDQPLTLNLKPTVEYRGQVLGKEDRPLQGRIVRAEIRVSVKPEDSRPYGNNFLGSTFTAMTDAEGNYSIAGLPCECAISLSTDGLDGSGGLSRLDEIYLLPNESRPRTVSKLWKAERKRSFAARIDFALRDCRLSGFGAMVILYRPGSHVSEFVKTNLVDYETTKDIAAFIQIEGKLGGESESDITSFARSKTWPLPDEGRVLALALDPAGRELGRIELDTKVPMAPKLAAEFIRRHAPAPVDARHKWEEAFAQAKKSNRKVWVRLSQRYCGPCFALTRWLDDQEKLLAQDYVFLKIDTGRDLHGVEMAGRLPGSEHQGIPYYAIFSPDGASLITSESPLGNIGHPSGFDAKRHLRKMIMTTRSKLTDQQVDEIVNSLKD